MARVAILTYNNAALFELGCAVELFGLARPEYDGWYECEVVSFERGPLAATGGIQLLAQRVESLADFDILVIPSWYTEAGFLEQTLARELMAFFHKGKRMVSFCSGAFLLAELGILDGSKATTHWRYAEKFKQRFPAVNFVEDVLYVYDGRVGCSAGSAAGLDLGIEIIRSDFGYKVANQVARRLVLSAHRSGGQAQFVETPVLAEPGVFAAVLDWALKNINHIQDVNELARRANMSRRTFDRKFRATLNLSANEWLTMQKLNAAKALLEHGDLSMEKIADAVGFETAMTLRHHFKKSLGLAPRQYREQFKSSRVQKS